MPKQIRFNGQVHTFPDAFTDEQIADALGQLTRETPTEAAPKSEGDAPQERSVGGFLENAVNSAGQFASDTISGIGSLVSFGSRLAQAQRDPREALKLGQDFIRAVKNSPEMGKVVFESLKDRYGSGGAILDTLYKDPVGVLADVSSVAGIAAGGAGVAGLAARNAPRVAGTANRVARVASQVERVTNPLAVAAPVVAKATEIGTAAAVRPFTKPSKALKRQQQAPLEIERTALRTGTFTEGQAARRARQAGEGVTQLAEQATIAGVTVPRADVVQMPRTLDRVAHMTPNLDELDTLAKLEAGAIASLPDQITPAELLSRRRQMDKTLNPLFRAAERGGPPTGIREAGQKEMSVNLRQALRDVAPEVKPLDDAARRFGLVEQTLEEAGLRAGDVPVGAALAGAALPAFGLPGAGIAGTAFTLGRTFPQIPLALGAIPVRGTAAAARAVQNPAVRGGLLSGRGVENAEEAIVAELMRRALMAEVGR